MKNVFALLLAGALATGAQAQRVIAQGIFRGHTYYLIESATWQQSEARAQQLGGHLVDIESAAEQLFVQQTFQNVGGVHRDLWIGLRRLNDGRWVWSNGKPRVTFTNWAPYQPDNGAGIEAYGEIIDPTAEYGGQWNDYPNDPMNNPSVLGRPTFGVVKLVAPQRKTGKTTKH